MIHSVDYCLVGNKIRDKRIEQGLNQKQLAEMCGVSTSYIPQIEHGTKAVSLEAAVRISKVLNVSLDYLILDEIQDFDRTIATIDSELNKLPQDKKETFIKFARLILKNIDEL